MVNWEQLFDLKRSSLGDSGDTDLTDSSPKTTLPFYQPKRIKQDNMDTPHQHPYGISSKTQTNTIFQAPYIGEGSEVETGLGSIVSSLLDHGCSTVKTVPEISFILCTYIVLFPNMCCRCRLACSHGMSRLSIQELMLWGNYWLAL